MSDPSEQVDFEVTDFDQGISEAVNALVGGDAPTDDGIDYSDPNNALLVDEPAEEEKVEEAEPEAEGEEPEVEDDADSDEDEEEEEVVAKPTSRAQERIRKLARERKELKAQLAAREAQAAQQLAAERQAMQEQLKVFQQQQQHLQQLAQQNAEFQRRQQARWEQEQEEQLTPLEKRDRDLERRLMQQFNQQLQQERYQNQQAQLALKAEQDAKVVEFKKKQRLQAALQASSQAVSELVPKDLPAEKAAVVKDNLEELYMLHVTSRGLDYGSPDANKSFKKLLDATGMLKLESAKARGKQVRENKGLPAQGVSRRGGAVKQGLPSQKKPDLGSMSIDQMFAYHTQRFNEQG